MKACFFVFVVLLFASPMVALADEPAATPDPGYGGVPLCQNPGDTDCVPDPGPRPEAGKMIYTRIDGQAYCDTGLVDVTIVTERIVRYYVGADNDWHPVTEEVDRAYTTRTMTDDEQAECGVLGPEILPDPIDSDEVVVITPELVATEELTEEVPVQLTEVDQPAETPAVVADEPAEAQSVPNVTSLPNTGSGTPAGSSFGVLLGISGVFALAGTVLRRRA